MLGRRRRRISNTGGKSDEERSQRKESGNRRGIKKEMGNGKEEKGHSGVMKDDEENSGRKIGQKEERKGKKTDIGAMKEKKDHEIKIEQSELRKESTEDSSGTMRSHIHRRKGKRKDSGRRMEDGGGVGLAKGLLLPQNVPVTSIHFRPGDKTTYLLGTSSGEVLLVSGCRLCSYFFVL